ncbi:3-phosphoshikimate 1-carboxyvinyltransferase [Advenella sp. WQ 585]|uniref:3-phosphoshikimate 1-carboxyvinyltransferase n=1 Tax=Advenella mandrilli TaxID=2800330 RepID=A0ABS1EGI4_9BURK|nr:3-phosphoshikimate 1-carboxyvinyltransferase [Advenella mandrilli]MBK1782122.1 3-phosphoshikimate 1-carboxyvinyltransferase [Advenella mandrilli]
MRTPFIDLNAAVTASGVVNLPGSKSISNRVLLLAALAAGSTRIEGLLDSDDTKVMLQALETLGISVERHDQETVTISGQADFPNKEAEIFLGNAGTAFRPLTAALAVLGGNYRLSGVPRMHERPIGDLVDALRSMGGRIDCEQNEGYPPLKIAPATLTVNGPVKVQGSVSSQFLTALLLVAPLIAQKTAQDVVLDVEGELISKPYIQITLNMMARFGVQVQQQGWSRFTIVRDAVYKSPGQVDIEGDASSASYFMALGLVGKGPVRINGVGKNSIQGDIRFAQTIQAMGGKIKFGDNWLEISGPDLTKGEKLKAFDEDFNLVPDAAMTAAVLALYADGPCMLRNIGSWRVKETDRIEAMHKELVKVGATVTSGPDWLRVVPPQASDWKTADIETYDDHRMAMCFSLAVFGPVGLRILDPDCVAKTFPSYFDIYKTLVR